jgi:hypothetical protein
MDILKSETSGDASTSIQTATILSSQGDGNQQRTTSTDSSTMLRRLRSSMDSHGNHGEGFVHTAWYIIQAHSYYLLTAGISSAAANSTIVNTLNSSATSTQSYVNALSSRKPHEDTALPQVQLTLQILLG